MTILRRLSPDELSRHYDRGTLARALDYALGGSVGSVEVHRVDAGGLRADALVQGNQHWPYQVSLDVQAHLGVVEVESLCSCPVSFQCKHGAALALVLGQAGEAAEPEPAVPLSWREQLAGLLTGLADLAPPSEPLPGVALELSLATPRYGIGPELVLRPLCRGKRGTWIKTGLSWGEVAAARQVQRFDGDQLDALHRLQQALAAGAGYHWYAGSSPPLAAFGPDVVALLEQAFDVGVTPVLRTPLVTLEVAPEPASVRAELIEIDDTTRIAVGVEVAGRLRRGDELTTYGDPAHTVSSLDDGVLTLARLQPRLSSAPLRILRAGEPVLVPTHDAHDLTERLRHLGRLVALDSPDGSVPLPDVVPPRLRVTITWDTAAAADVAWDCCYGDDAFALDGAAPPQVARDRTAEQALRAAVDPPPPSARYRVDGPDALHLALLELPVWRAVEGVEVVEVAAPQFREAEGAPEISFTVTDPATDALTDSSSGSTEAPPPDVPTDWLDLFVVLTIEGEQIPLALVLEALTLGQEHLVLPSGLYVRTDHPALARLVDVVRSAADLRERRSRAATEPEDAGRLRVAGDDLGVWAQLGDLGEIVDPEGRARSWVDRARALRDLVALPRPEPHGIVSTLRSYQLDGFHWLAFLWQQGLGGILADDMGLGKTLQVLALVAHTRESATHADPEPFLVVAPTSVVSAWVREARRHAPGLRIAAVTASGSRRDSSIADLAAEADVVVTTYTLLRLEQDDYAAIAWGGLVLDEAQQIKNHRSLAHEAVRRIRAPFRLAVTGTPFENRLLELWSLLDIVAPGLYPQQRSFVDQVVRPVEKQGDTAALRRFTRRIRPFVLRRTKDLVAADLPPLQEQVLDVELESRHRKVYDAHLARERQRILGLVDDDFDSNRVAILAALTRLRQLALDPALVEPDLDHLGSAKLDVLVEHLREISAEGHRALVFSQFTGFLTRVRARLEAEGLEVAYLDGATQRRGEVVESFRTGTAPVFLISLKAGGTGLTITEADYVFVLDPWWNPAAEAQAVGRAHRIGQTRTVMVYRLVSTDTIEEKVMALKARKAALFAQVIDGGAGTFDGIGADDIRALFDD